MMKIVFSVCLLLAALGCSPKPPIYVVTKSSSSAIAAISTAKFEIGKIGKVDLHDFKRAFVKKYGDEASFVKAFQEDLNSQMAVGVAPNSATYYVELPVLDVDNYVVTSTMMVGGGPNMPGHVQTTSTEYCVIKISYIVKDKDGATLLEGQVQERTAKGEFLHPNQSKLNNAVQGVQKHLVDYLRGRMAVENIQTPPPAKVA